MSINRNRTTLKKAICSNDYRKIWLNELHPPYWDDWVYLFPTYRRGFKNSSKQLYPCEVREFKTWKHNRKTQWK